MYNTTAEGGSSGDGTVFALNSNTGAESVVYSFCSQQNCADGETPIAGLIDVHGTLFGTTGGGGSHTFWGTEFAIDQNTGTEKVLHSFGRGTDGKSPDAGLIDMRGKLYGTTSEGGGGTYCTAQVGYGTVFALDPKTGTETVLSSFCGQDNCTDGAYPFAGLTDVNGTLYGTTAGGGTGCNSYGCGRGTVFALDPKSGAKIAVKELSFGKVRSSILSGDSTIPASSTG
jgi:uncharacterized repeat protein (TIGR03803 family)